MYFNLSISIAAKVAAVGREGAAFLPGCLSLTTRKPEEQERPHSRETNPGLGPRRFLLFFNTSLFSSGRPSLVSGYSGGRP
jgi:hypothetical protein